MHYPRAPCTALLPGSSVQWCAFLSRVTPLSLQNTPEPEYTTPSLKPRRRRHYLRHRIFLTLYVCMYSVLPHLSNTEFSADSLRHLPPRLHCGEDGSLISFGENATKKARSGIVDAKRRWGKIN